MPAPEKPKSAVSRAWSFFTGSGSISPEKEAHAEPERLNLSSPLRPPKDEELRLLPQQFRDAVSSLYSADDQAVMRAINALLFVRREPVADKYSRPVRPYLTEVFKHHAQENVRAALLECLSVMEGRNAVDVYVYALRDNSAVVRKKALAAIEKHGSEREILALRQFIDRVHENELFKARAKDIIGKLRER
ncbi:TPA: HEAT repeat domain-containing protein [Candidatus Micrarchaeota archaeon]|nr:HEAT repeat domain-containing protein [Candidatus Micrarchaeota archaeon]